MEDLRVRVGGAPALTCNVMVVDNPEEVDVDNQAHLFPSSAPFVEIGLEGGLSILSSSSRDSLPNIPS